MGKEREGRRKKRGKKCQERGRRGKERSREGRGALCVEGERPEEGRDCRVQVGGGEGRGGGN